jgi:hypothetical protein
MENEPTTPLFPQTDFDKYCFMKSFVRFLRFEIGLITSERDEYRDLYYSLKNKDRSDLIRTKKVHQLKQEVSELRKENAALSTELIRLKRADYTRSDVIQP